MKGEISIETAAIEGTKEYNTLGSNPKTIQEYVNLPPGLSAIAIGRKDGVKTKSAVGLICFPSNGMAGETSCPLAIATDMMIEGKFTNHGVFTPEESIDPNEFFERLAPYCGKNNLSEIKAEAKTTNAQKSKRFSNTSSMFEVT